VLGPLLFNHSLVVYGSFALVPLVALLIQQTHFGLRLRAVGEDPDAAMALGVDPVRTRWQALLVCGVLAGFGGAQLVLASLGVFTENVTSGRGFIALAAVIFGRWKPGWTAAAVVLFAAADAFQVRAQVLGLGVPYQLLVALPYLVTLAALAGLIKNMRPPSALGRPVTHR
ncbi:MAG: ABC transporter permease, partial [Nitriliruptoraceae bacterium]